MHLEMNVGPLRQGVVHQHVRPSPGAPPDARRARAHAVHGLSHPHRRGPGPASTTMPDMAG